jgi:hypothetical protein
MEFLKKAWGTFRRLKTWLQVVIALVLISIIGSIGGSGGTSDNKSSSNTTSTTKSPSPSVSETPIPDPTPTQTKPAVSDAEYKSALSKMRVSKDDVKGYKWYFDRSSPKYVNQNGFFIYTSADSDPTLFLKIQYSGDDWLFIDSYFFNIDGETFEINPSYGEVETDNDSSVWEWYNKAATAENIEMIQKIIKSKKTVMRLEGSKYYKDVTISQAQKTALKNVLAVYQGLGGSPQGV